MTWTVPEAKSDVIYRQSILTIIQAAIDAHPRSAQSQIGPSEVGGCETKVAWKLAYGGDSEREGGYAAWKGTVLHAELDRIFKSTLAPVCPDGSQRFFSDLKLAPVSPHVNGGTLDLYDALYETVLDWKCPGQFSMDAVYGGKLNPGYFIQSQIYGLGLEAAGHKVSRVALMFLPMNGDVLHQTARGAKFVYWDYDRNVAWDAIHNVQRIQDMISVAGIQKVLEVLPKRSDFCSTCPASSMSGDRRATCPGVSGKAAVQRSGNPFG